LAVEHTAVENLEAQLGQWRQRGSIVGVIIRDDEGKDWKWDGQDWAAVSELETELAISKGREEGKQLVIDQLEATLKEAELQRDSWERIAESGLGIPQTETTGETIFNKDITIIGSAAETSAWRCPCGQQNNGPKCSYCGHANYTAETFAEPIDQAPIARVIVTDGAPAGVVLYAPGLPPGEFDVYLEPIAKGEQS